MADVISIAERSTELQSFSMLCAEAPALADELDAQKQPLPEPLCAVIVGFLALGAWAMGLGLYSFISAVWP